MRFLPNSPNLGVFFGYFCDCLGTSWGRNLFIVCVCVASRQTPPTSVAAASTPLPQGHLAGGGPACRDFPLVFVPVCVCVVQPVVGHLLLSRPP